MNLQKLIFDLYPHPNIGFNYLTINKIHKLILHIPQLLEELNLEAISKLLRELLFNISSWCSNSIKIILKFGTNLSPLQIALLQGDIKFVESQLKNGEKPDGPNWYVDSLINCIFWRKNIKVRKELLKLLIEYGFNTKFKNALDDNILHIFIKYFVKEEDGDAAEISAILIDSGSLVNEVDQEGWIPLLHSIYTQNIQLISLLIEKGADVNYLSDGIDNLFPLISAAECNSEEFIDLLLSNGVNIDSKTSSGSTALHEACRAHMQESINFLMLKGADVNVEDINGQTPFALLSPEDDDYNFCMSIMVEQFSKMIHNNDLISKKNMDLIKSNSRALKYFESCMTEIDRMKSTIFYAPYSYYFVFEFCKNSVKKLAKLTKNEEFVTNFKANIENFPYFKMDLEAVFAEAIYIRDESIIVHSKLYSTFKDIFPELIIRKLEENLNSNDLPLS